MPFNIDASRASVPHVSSSSDISNNETKEQIKQNLINAQAVFMYTKQSAVLNKAFKKIMHQLNDNPAKFEEMQNKKHLTIKGANGKTYLVRAMLAFNNQSTRQWMPPDKTTTREEFMKNMEQLISMIDKNTDLNEPSTKHNVLTFLKEKFNKLCEIFFAAHHIVNKEEQDTVKKNLKDALLHIKVEPKDGQNTISIEGSYDGNLLAKLDKTQHKDPIQDAHLTGTNMSDSDYTASLVSQTTEEQTIKEKLLIERENKSLKAIEEIKKESSIRFDTTTEILDYIDSIFENDLFNLDYSAIKKSASETLREGIYSAYGALDKHIKQIIKSKERIDDNAKYISVDSNKQQVETIKQNINKSMENISNRYKVIMSGLKNYQGKFHDLEKEGEDKVYLSTLLDGLIFKLDYLKASLVQ